MDNRVLLAMVGVGLILIALGISLYHAPAMNKYTFVSGSLIGWGNYAYVIVKGDDTRYLYHTDDKDNVILDGPIDIALASQLDAWDNLIAHAEKHGPIGSHNITAEEISLLQNVGFEVEEKK